MSLSSAYVRIFQAHVTKMQIKMYNFTIYLYQLISKLNQMNLNDN